MNGKTTRAPPAPSSFLLCSNTFTQSCIQRLLGVDKKLTSTLLLCVTHNISVTITVQNFCYRFMTRNFFYEIIFLLFEIVVRKLILPEVQ